MIDYAKTNEKIARLFKEVFADIELDCKKFLIDIYSTYPHLRIYITWKAYRESIGAKHEACYSFETENFPWLYDSTTTKHEMRRFLQEQIVGSINRLK